MEHSHRISPRKCPPRFIKTQPNKELPHLNLVNTKIPRVVFPHVQIWSTHSIIEWNRLHFYFKHDHQNLDNIQSSHSHKYTSVLGPS